MYLKYNNYTTSVVNGNETTYIKISKVEYRKVMRYLHITFLGNVLIFELNREHMFYVKTGGKISFIGILNKEVLKKN